MEGSRTGSLAALSTLCPFSGRPPGREPRQGKQALRQGWEGPGEGDSRAAADSQASTVACCYEEGMCDPGLSRSSKFLRADGNLDFLSR